MTEETSYWVAFNRVPGIGPARFRRLIEQFGALSRAWMASEAALVSAGLEPALTQSLLDARRRIIPERELERVYRCGARVMTWQDQHYPALLRTVTNPPPVLYMKGALEPADQFAIAVVGTRKATTYGREAAHVIVSELARAQISIVSGLAKGIDAVAHRSALQAGGRTIAVLGTGVDTVYPPEHVQLAAAVAECGALISDYPIGARPEAQNFPARNRIIAGLALGVVVIEAGERSGAMISANFALEQGREVFAVPGSIFSPMSQGANHLIQDGAKLVRRAIDIIEELNLAMVPEQRQLKELVPDSPLEADLLALLSHEPRHIDELMQSVRNPIAEVSSTLAMMELKGLIRQLGSMNYIRAH